MKKFSTETLESFLADLKVVASDFERLTTLNAELTALNKRLNENQPIVDSIVKVVSRVSPSFHKVIVDQPGDLYKKLVVAFEAELNARNLKESKAILGAETLEQKIAVFNVENPVVEDNLEIEVVKPTKKAKK